MRKLYILIAAALLLSLVLMVSVHIAGAAQANGDNVVHVIEHAITDTVVDIGPKGDSRGDLLAFANPVFDEKDKTKVGSDSGNCVRTDPGKLYECNWTTFLDGGQITVEGPFFDSGADSMLSIIGGTGKYRGASGQMKLHARGNPVGSEFDFIFSLN
ncbi:MAG TPA: allene oxide cyclase family protein [Ktedonosporobacter sp.]|nr:allene oxide cyclase family protein [Ktedonosporobacter sp.]